MFLFLTYASNKIKWKETNYCQWFILLCCLKKKKGSSIILLLKFALISDITTGSEYKSYIRKWLSNLYFCCCFHFVARFFFWDRDYSDYYLFHYPHKSFVLLFSVIIFITSHRFSSFILQNVFVFVTSKNMWWLISHCAMYNLIHTANYSFIQFTQWPC